MKRNEGEEEERSGSYERLKRLSRRAVRKKTKRRNTRKKEEGTGKREWLLKEWK